MKCNIDLIPPPKDKEIRSTESISLLLHHWNIVFSYTTQGLFRGPVIMYPRC
uniref:Uncharacterized protein n=1 Tax=Anguilla anguilla TaxID=7936 RepID=A0A0E9U632_ANGAN